MNEATRQTLPLAAFKVIRPNEGDQFIAKYLFSRTLEGPFGRYETHYFSDSDFEQECIAVYGSADLNIRLAQVSKNWYVHVAREGTLHAETLDGTPVKVKQWNVTWALYRGELENTRWASKSEAKGSKKKKRK